MGQQLAEGRIAPTRPAQVATAEQAPGGARRVALGLAAARIVLGLAAMAAPGVVIRGWIGAEAEHPGPSLLGRALGGRDVALGLGAVLAAQRRGPLRGWVEAGVLSDTTDTVATALAFGRLPLSRWLVLFASAGAAATGALAARSL